MAFPRGSCVRSILAPSPNSSYSFKCVMVGHQCVGKTCLTNRIATGRFIDSPITTFSAASVKVEVKLPSGAIVNIDLWDTAGQERYRSLTQSYFRDAKAVLLVYDAENKTKIRDWLKEVRRHVTWGDALLFLIGTKLDLGAEICLSEEEIQSLSRIEDTILDIAGHYVLSSKTGENVAQSVERMAESVVVAGKEKRLDLTQRRGTVRARGEREGQDKNGNCC
ncbi:ras-related protein Rab-21-like [Littorina saxatilis]|uniref:Uncharacterized protein n=1 Tax=Littorina saxatilis TaxID=31220 RepID=A0AAN9ARZ3_9CAEN